MTLPIHTVQHVRSLHTKYQIIAVFFSLLAMAAALLAVVSGFQLNKLRKDQAAQIQAAQTPVPPPASVDEASGRQIESLNKQVEALNKQIEAFNKQMTDLNHQIGTLESQLADERITAQELRIKIQDLERKLAEAKSGAAEQPAPIPSNPVTPKAEPGPASMPVQAPSPADVQAVSQPATAPAASVQTIDKPIPTPAAPKPESQPAAPADSSAEKPAKPTASGADPVPVETLAGPPAKTPDEAGQAANGAAPERTAGQPLNEEPPPSDPKN